MFFCYTLWKIRINLINISYEYRKMMMMMINSFYRYFVGLQFDLFKPAPLRPGHCWITENSQRNHLKKNKKIKVWKHRLYSSFHIYILLFYQVEWRKKKRERIKRQRKITSKGLLEGLSLLIKLCAHFEGIDPNIKWFVRTEQVAHNVCCPHDGIYEKKKANDPDKIQVMKQLVNFLTVWMK